MCVGNYGDVTIIIYIEGDTVRMEVIDQGPPINELDFGTNKGIYKDYLENCKKAILFGRLNLDNVVINNLGKKGRKLILTKHVNYKEDDPQLDDKEKSKLFSQIYEGKIYARKMKLDEAGELSRLAWEIYGRSYLFEKLYYPDKIKEQMKYKKMIPFVAVTDKDEILGALTIIRNLKEPAICEIGQGMVANSIRRRGIFSDLTKLCIEEAGKEGYKGVFAQAVTVHSLSQKTAISDGLREVSLLFGYLPSDMYFGGRHNAGSKTKRNSVMTFFHCIKPPTGKIIYVPKCHADIVTKIYSQFNYEPKISTNPPMADDEVASLEVHTDKSEIGLARIVIKNYIPNIDHHVLANLNQLITDNYQAIWLDLPLSKPATALMVEQFQKLGFFFAGVIPHLFSPSGDILRLQYLNYEDVNLELDIYSDFGNELANYIIGEYHKYHRLSSVRSLL
jgi:serine/threonine-protein kinase RsbW